MRLLFAATFALWTLAPIVFADATSPANKRCFPDDFLFGSATAAYQVEGGWNETGRTPSIWDDFCRDKPELQCANVADDFLHRYKQDIDLMVESNLDSFRFSISWSRVMNWDPATKRMKANAPGIAFYHDLLDTLRAKGVVPIVTLYHFDLPRELHTKLSQSWLSRDIIGHFVEYAELMFHEYGTKVEYWSTFNEPWSFVVMGYGAGAHPPALPQSTTNTYTAAHNVLLSHAYAVKRFRELKAQSVVHANAKIGIVLPTDYSYPLDPSNPKDVAAAERKMQFMLGWFLRPIALGEYPLAMRERVGDRLPSFTAEETALVKGSYDVFMLNHYHSTAVTDCDSPTSSINCSSLSLGWYRDHGCDDTRRPVGARKSGLGPNGEELCTWFSAYPKGYSDTIRWMHKHDPSASILLTENGYCGNSSIDNPDQTWYFQRFLEQVHIATVDEKIPVIGYTAWSFVDNYEWGSFKPRFGLYYVNFTSETGSKNGYTPEATDLARIPRAAAKWYAQLAKTKCMDVLPVEIVTMKAAANPESSGFSSFVKSSFVVVLVGAMAIVAVAVQRHRRQGTRAEASPLLH